MFKDRIADIDAIKTETDKYRPLPTQSVSMLKEHFRVALTYSSNALEGNTLTQTETKIILEDGMAIGGKSLKEHFEVVGHSNAYDFMWQKARANQLLEGDIIQMHRLLCSLVDQENAGHYRKGTVFGAGTGFDYPKPAAVPLLMKDFLREIPQFKAQYHPVNFAALVHIRLIAIHPFIDGTGRIARLFMNLALLQSGYVITTIPPTMKAAYVVAIQQANKGNGVPFFEFISEMVLQSSKEYLELIRSTAA